MMTLQYVEALRYAAELEETFGDKHVAEILAERHRVRRKEFGNCAGTRVRDCWRILRRRDIIRSTRIFWEFGWM